VRRGENWLRLSDDILVAFNQVAVVDGLFVAGYGVSLNGDALVSRYYVASLGDIAFGIDASGLNVDVQLLFLVIGLLPLPQSDDEKNGRSWPMSRAWKPTRLGY